MEKEIKEYMSKFDKETAQKETLEKQNAEPNEEGWVTVSKK